ncbi:MAG: hypothetical protein NZ522_09550, partial [Chitinophagales bacterium]|nr:hypothetical protein [Chitinophagales bacterium]
MRIPLAGIIFFLALVQAAYCQISRELNCFSADTITQRLFLQQNWKDLVKTGKFFTKKCDFYFLNIRMGIALFNEKRFVGSEIFLKKAVSQNDNPYAREYLLWSQLINGNYFMAKKTFSKLPA